MQQEYTKEQLWKLYDHLPAELKEAIFSAETADAIYDTCIRNGIEESRIPEFASLAGNVLLGLLVPDDFQIALEKELKIKKDIARKIAQEINRFVFFPVKNHLAALHMTGITRPTEPAKFNQEKPAEEKPAIEESAREINPKTSGKDTYRENVEG